MNEHDADGDPGHEIDLEMLAPFVCESSGGKGGRTRATSFA